MKAGPLMLLTITAKKNHANLDNIRQQHLQLSDPKFANNLDIGTMPVVVYMGYSIHGNEPSGANAALLAAYWLAACKSSEVATYLDNAVILLDPCFNPDGFHRFSTWANMHKNEHLTSDPSDREYNEVWPRGRTNHYWFDLNRDWLLLAQPESRGRISLFHKWKPNVLTDHHEMGTNNTFFFQPGVPSRVNSNTPKMNQVLTAKIGSFHAQGLDEIGSFYYSGEGFDDFYYGKGSTYPDVNGSIGILFEQASSRGHLQESANGMLSFPFTIRNQLTTSISTVKASVALREELLSYQRDFYLASEQIAQNFPIKGYIFSAKKDQSRLIAFLDILIRHQIDVYQISSNYRDFQKENSFIVPVNQKQSRLVKTIFEEVTTFEDSLFYDVSAWTFPHAFDLFYEEMDERAFNINLLGEKIKELPKTKGEIIGGGRSYAYLMEWNDYLAPSALYALQKLEIRTKVSTDLFDAQIDGERKLFDRGTILIPVENQYLSPDELYEAVKKISQENGIHIYHTAGGAANQGKDLGSPSFRAVAPVKVALLVGNGVSSYDAGEVWHLMDQRYQIDISKIDVDRLNRTDLSRYTTIIMVDGSYSNAFANKLKDWVGSGGQLIIYKRAISWANRNGLANHKIRTADKTQKGQSSYGNARNENGAKVIGGAFFMNRMDLSHPISYGYEDENIALFRRGTTAYEPAENNYATPLRYHEGNPLVSGYIHSSQIESLSGSAGIIVYAMNRGKVIAFTDNTNFRAYTYGTNKLLANAIFFGSIINSVTCERIPRKGE